jgi:protein-disulfide isomerase
MRASLQRHPSLPGRQGKSWEMHDLLIKQSPKLDRQSLIFYARELGLDIAKFTSSIDGQKHKLEIDRDLELAVKMDLYNTPTFYINGRKVVGEQ